MSVNPDPASWVLYADPALLVINKPAGLPSLPDGYHKEAPHVKSVLEPLYGSLWIVHRLDKETSGILALARSAEAHRSLNTQFELHTIQKIYHALARGQADWQSYAADLPLRANGDRRHRTVVDPSQGKAAITNFRILELFLDWTWLEARPETGRTHQIRAHLAALGLPLAGDLLYGGKDNLYPLNPSGTPMISRLCLHAQSLTLQHPLSHEPLTLTAPYPEDLLGVLNFLRS